MYGTGLKKLGAEWSLKPMNGMLCGVIHGLPVTLCEGMGYKQLVITLCMPSSVKENTEVDVGNLLTQPASYYRITDYTVSNLFLTVRFHDNPGTMRMLREYVDVEMPRIRDAGFVGTDHCSYCGQAMQDESAVLYTLHGGLLSVHAHCAQEMEADIQSLSQAANDGAAQAKSKPFAFIGALLGGLIGCIPWILLYVLGYIASLATMLIALGINYGHRLFGGQAGKGRFVLVIVLTLLITPLANVLGIVAQFGYSIHTGELQEAWGVAKESLALTDTIPLIIDIMSIPEVAADMIGSFARELITSYLFAGLGLWAVWKKLRTENLPKESKLVKLA